MVGETTQALNELAKIALVLRESCYFSLRLPAPSATSNEISRAAAITRNRHRLLTRRSEYVSCFSQCAAVKHGIVVRGTAQMGNAFRGDRQDDRRVDTNKQDPENAQFIKSS